MGRRTRRREESADRDLADFQRSRSAQISHPSRRGVRDS